MDIQIPYWWNSATRVTGDSDVDEFQNLPSPVRAAIPGDGVIDENLVGSAVHGVIFFDPPVDSISYLVGNHLRTRHTAYANGIMIDQEVTEPNNTNLSYSSWQEVSLAGTSGITELFIDYPDHDSGTFAIDNLRIVRRFMCPDNASWFRDLGFRQQLADAWQESVPISPTDERITAVTKEKGGWIIRDGNSYRLHTESIVTSNWCSIANPRPLEYPTCSVTTDPETVCIAGKIHTHPLETGRYINEVECGKIKKGVPVRVKSQRLSEPDLKRAIELAQFDLSYFVLYEGGGILEYDPSQPDSTRRYPGCLGESAY